MMDTRTFTLAYRLPRKVDPIATLLRPLDFSVWAALGTVVVALWATWMHLRSMARLSSALEWFHLCALTVAPLINVSLSDGLISPGKKTAPMKVLLWVTIPTLSAASLIYR